MNGRKLEEKERMLKEILSLFYETLYLWTTAYMSPLSLSYSEFFVRFTLSS
jgi:hypothetical protein